MEGIHGEVAIDIKFQCSTIVAILQIMDWMIKTVLPEDQESME